MEVANIETQAAQTAYEKEKQKIAKLKDYCVTKSKKWMTEIKKVSKRSQEDKLIADTFMKYMITTNKVATQSTLSSLVKSRITT